MTVIKGDTERIEEEAATGIILETEYSVEYVTDLGILQINVTTKMSNNTHSEQDNNGRSLQNYQHQ